MVSRKFAALMEKASVNAAINLLSENMRNWKLPLNNETMNRLKLKHPKSKKADKNTMLADIPEKNRAIRFESIGVELISKAATKTMFMLHHNFVHVCDRRFWIVIAKMYNTKIPHYYGNLCNLNYTLSSNDK